MKIADRVARVAVLETWMERIAQNLAFMVGTRFTKNESALLHAFLRDLLKQEKGSEDFINANNE